MTFTNPQVAALRQEARLAQESGEMRFFAAISWRRTGFLGGHGDALPAGSVPVVGAAVAAIEEEGWELEHIDTLPSDAQAMGLVTCATFKRDLR